MSFRCGIRRGTLPAGTLDVRVLCRLAGLHELQTQAELIGPLVERAAGDLRASVGQDCGGAAVWCEGTVEKRRAARSRGGPVGPGRRASARVVVSGALDPRTLASPTVSSWTKPMDQRSDGTWGRWQVAALLTRGLFAVPLDHTQPLLSAQTVEPLVVGEEALAAKHNQQSAVAPAWPTTSCFAKCLAQCAVHCLDQMVVVVVPGQSEGLAAQRSTPAKRAPRAIGSRPPRRWRYHFFELVSLSILSSSSVKRGLQRLGASAFLRQSPQPFGPRNVPTAAYSLPAAEGLLRNPVTRHELSGRFPLPLLPAHR